MSNLRFEAVSEASKRKPVEVTAPSERPSEFFGKKVFNRQKMYKYLPADVYEKLVDVIDNGARLDRNIANAVAKGIKQWADERDNSPPHGIWNVRQRSSNARTCHEPRKFCFIDEWFRLS